MNILVCVKQVPDTTQIKIDPVKHTLIREGVPAILNPFDGYALEAAARIKDKDPSTKITVVTMGPPQAVAVLKECVAKKALSTLSSAASRQLMVILHRSALRSLSGWDFPRLPTALSARLLKAV